ncbi:MAG TPA: DUF378 domain-containing protein [Armatimonadota bacterium]|nr:DUF378 domain-containing protein [Armatimonadota bacterium]
MKMKKALKGIAPVLVTVGAINWGLVGMAKVDLVEKLFGHMSAASRAVYSLVGASGAYYLASIGRQVREETSPV